MQNRLRVVESSHTAPVRQKMALASFLLFLLKFLAPYPKMYKTSSSHEGLPPFCPVCGLGAIRKLDLGLLRGDSQAEVAVGGVQAFICTVNQHVFFVRISDLVGAKKAD